ncbi:hypothetical protein SNE40_011028 [Patella caerulea]|uniref:Bifunctional lysine-specific demethylase and histidyl-hydroxylase n=1 Tax=Patella caerulea TaxID=87958 RepID=A0AAN8K387_PATCE
MKKMSAFSVFSGKSKRTKAMTELEHGKETPDMDENKSRGKSNLRRADSTPTVPGDLKKESGTKGKKILKVLKGGSLRSTFRGKGRPSILPEGQVPSPYIANDAVSNGIELTALKKNGDFGSITSMISVDKKTKNSPNKSKDDDRPKGKSPASPRNQKGKSQVTPRVTRTSPTKRHLESPDVPSKKKKKDVEPEEQLEEPEEGPSTKPESASRLPYMFDSSKEAKKLFECIINPVKLDRFFAEFWERKPLLIQRYKLTPYYNDGWFSTAELDHILRQENIQYSVNLDVTSYENGKRETHNPIGRAYAPVVWDYYQSGCSLRLLNPQTYSRRVWKLLSVLQEYFGCCVGANIYLTPPGTQGFAPHYDDIEAFILQLEGRKNWKLYATRTGSEKLPRFSSENLNEADLGEPILNRVLEAGDLLYFPRGTIHQASALEDSHSLHITVSCYQKNSWFDFFEKLLPRALQIAYEEDVELRKGVPLNYLQNMGVVNSDKETPERKMILNKVEKLMTSIFKNAPIDAAFDQMGRGFIHDSLPPVLSESEKSCSIHGTGERWDSKRNQVTSMVEIEPDSMVKIIRQGALRLVLEEDQVHVYHNLENSRIYQGVEPQFVDIPLEAAPAVEFLIHSYPEYISVDSLPLEDIQLKIDIITALYEKGLLLTQEPLEPLYEDGSVDDEKPE